MIHFRCFTEDDIATLIGWVSSEEILMQFAGPGLSFPLTDEQLKSYMYDNNRQVFVVVDDMSKLAIGHAELYFPDNETAYLCRILIGDPKMRGKGIGRIITNLLLQRSFGELNKKKAELYVFDWNTSAVRCYEKAGFKINPGKEKTREIGGQTWVAVNMVLKNPRISTTINE